MYSYHNRIRQRIKNGELTNFYFTKSYPNIGKALVLVFSTEPFLRPIRPHRWGEYIDLLKIPLITLIFKMKDAFGATF